MWQTHATFGSYYMLPMQVPSLQSHTTLQKWVACPDLSFPESEMTFPQSQSL